MSLSQYLEDVQKNSLGDDQGPWRQFILDHLDYIARRSTVFTIDAEVMALFRYDLKRFLRENRSRQLDMAWIVLLLNSLSNDFEFKDAGDYIIPTDDLIRNLYQSYATVQRNAK